MKSNKILVITGILVLGSLAFAESEQSFDYEKNIQEKKLQDQKNIEAYSKKNNISIEKSTNQYYKKLKDEFKENETIRQEMIKNNQKD